MTKQWVSASAKQRTSLPGLPWQSGHTSWATVGSQCCPCARGRSRGGTREASAAWPAGWWDSSRHPAGAPSGGALCSPWWGPPVETGEHLECYEIYSSFNAKKLNKYLEFFLLIENVERYRPNRSNCVSDEKAHFKYLRAHMLVKHY